MPGNPPAPNIAIVLVAAVLVIALISPVSSYDFEKSFAETHYQDGWAKYSSSNTGLSVPIPFDGIYSNRVQDFVGIKSIVTTMSLYSGFPRSGVGKSTTFEGFIGETYVCSGTIGYNINHDDKGDWKNTIYYILFDDFNPKQFSGAQYITLVWDTDIVQKPNYPSAYITSIGSPNEASADYLDSYIAFAPQNTGRLPIGLTSQYYLSHNWYQTLGINDYDYYLDVYLNRHSSASEISIIDTSSNALLYTNTSTLDVITRVYSPNIDITILSPLNTYSLEYPPEDVGDVTAVTVYVQNSQTGALLGDARLSILASAGGTETEIINTTLPGGTASYTLQPTGGGSPNPDYYRAVATVPGYTQIIENHSFTLSGPHDVIIEMRPDSGGPLDPERAYLEFYVRDLNANPIPAASIQCNNQIKQTNSAGYAIFEVAKNSTHPWIAKKSGYTTIEGTATTGPNPRYVVNVVLGPGTVPTYTPTPGPGETPGGPGATPTPDHRTNEQKGQAVIDMIADNAEGIGALALICLLLGLLKLMVKW